MIALDPPFRQATPADARALADLVHFASEGLALHVWTKVAGAGGNPWEGGRIAAALIGYPLPDRPEPIPQDMPAMFVPLQELENLAPGTWYVNVLAAYPEDRGKGHGTALLAIAEELASDTGRRGLSIIVSDANEGARRLYERRGYREIARRRKVKEDWDGPGTHWVLLVKQP